MWFYARNGEQHGPVEADDIRNRLRSGDLSNDTLVWKEGMAQWAPLGDILELREPVPSGSVPSGANPSSAGSAAAASPTSPDTAPAANPAMQPAAPQLVAPMPQNTMALVSMILGLVGIVACAFTSIPAVICGHIARKQFRESPTPQSGEGMATTGLILGYIITILSIVGVIGYAVMFAVLINSEGSSLVPTPAPPSSVAP